jgi:hypothetical protein
MTVTTPLSPMRSYTNFYFAGESKHVDATNTFRLGYGASGATGALGAKNLEKMENGKY